MATITPSTYSTRGLRRVNMDELEDTMSHMNAVLIMFIAAARIVPHLINFSMNHESQKSIAIISIGDSANLSRSLRFSVCSEAKRA